jgi:hypothetical protein
LVSKENRPFLLVLSPSRPKISMATTDLMTF